MAGAGDFCNSFWGLGDAGVEVLFARMSGAARTMEELKAYWKERAAIEEDYSERLGRLAKTALGKDEVGDLRTSFDTLRLETEKQGGYHLQLAQQIRADLEGAVTSFCGRQAHHKKSFQSVIEKNFKAKQTQEAYVDKARQKYETDCMRINAFTAQATLMQGKELEKLQLKLDRARQTVQANQRDFANFARALGDTVRQWEVDWKAFCDSCQDLEDDRMEFLKDNLWEYPNAIATVCVSDDVSAEHLRLSLETFEPERDMENFIRDYATGNAIPDPPAFVDYNASDAVSSASARPTSRPASFARSSQRAARDGPGHVPPQPMAQPDPPLEELEQEPVSSAGLGEGGESPQQPQSFLNRNSIPGADPERYSGFGDDTNPLARQMGEYRSGSTMTGENASRRRSSDINQPTSPKGSPQHQQRFGPPSRVPTADSEALSSANGIGSHSSAVVGGSSHLPNPLTAALKNPPARLQSAIPVEEVTVNHQRNSPRSSFVSALEPLPSLSGPTPAQGQMRSPSPNGHSDSGTNGQITVPFQPVSASHAASPQMQIQGQQPSFTSSPQGGYSAARQRSLSPNSVGITLDPTGEVTVDHTADLYNQQQRPPPQQQQQQQQWNQSPMQPMQTGYGAPPPSGPSPMYVPLPPPPGQPILPPHQMGQVQRQTTYDQTPQRQPMYGQQQQAPLQPAYQPPPPPPQQAPPAPPVQQLHQPPPLNGMQQQQTGYYQRQQQQPVQHQQASYHSGYGGYNRAPSPHGQPMARSPSPQPPAMGGQGQQQDSGPPPTGQHTEDGKPVLFYVKGLYDYQATIEEEFDFQAGDIIAVIATPEDGWWSGELLDEQRRQPGRNVFPSNFVCLF